MSTMPDWISMQKEPENDLDLVYIHCHPQSMILLQDKGVRNEFSNPIILLFAVQTGLMW